MAITKMNDHMNKLGIGFWIMYSLSCTAIADDVLNPAIEHHKQIEAKLKSDIKNIEQALAEEPKKRFLENHKMWLRFAELEASLKADLTSGGGSAYTEDYLHELSLLYSARIKDLNSGTYKRLLERQKPVVP